MSLTSCLCDDPLRQWIVSAAKSAGIDRIGFARAERVAQAQTVHYNDWLKEGNHAEMTYLERYPDVRSDPRELLPGAKTIISCAISYWHPEKQAEEAAQIAMYAHGDDYHDVVRDALREVAEEITRRNGAECRVCVDTAPIHERYWALRSGVGFRGLNGLVIVPEVGSYCFLGEIITTLELEPTPPLEAEMCEGCGMCLDACPGKALKGKSTMDCRKCLSYLTIEYRGDFPEGFHTGGRLVGCDECQKACPHNLTPRPTIHERLHLRPELATLTAEQIEALTPDSYAAMFRGSAIKRLKHSGLKRNIKSL